MTLDEIVVLGMARTSEITSTYPTSKALAYRRVGLRQRELMAIAARENPEYYGVCAESPLDGNTATDLNDIVEPVPTPELIQLVTVADPGTSQWVRGQVIAIVSVADPRAELPPRATLRDLVLQGVGTDLTGVVSVEIHYPRIAAELGPNDRATVIELQSPFNQLLEIDLTKYLLAKATRLDPAIKTRAMADLSAEEAPLYASYLDHVRAYGPLSTRFGAAREPAQVDTVSRPVVQ